MEVVRVHGVGLRDGREVARRRPHLTNRRTPFARLIAHPIRTELSRRDVMHLGVTGGVYLRVMCYAPCDVPCNVLCGTLCNVLRDVLCYVGGAP